MNNSVYIVNNKLQEYNKPKSKKKCITDNISSELEQKIKETINKLNYKNQENIAFHSYIINEKYILPSDI